MLSKLLTPRYALPILFLVVVGVVLVTPQKDLGMGGPQLSIESTRGGGGRGIYETIRGLGWNTEVRTTPFGDSLATDVVYAVLGPAIPLTTSESEKLLAAVAAGAHLIFVQSGPSAVLDSLGVQRTLNFPQSLDSTSGEYATVGAAREGCAPSVFGTEDRFMLVAGFDFGDSVPAFARRFLSAGAQPSVPVAVGMQYGAGRVVLVSSAELLTNDVIRRCHSRFGPLAVRMFEWLAAPGERTVVFDEFHHGAGVHPSIGGFIRRILFRTPGGRVLLQLLLAGAVLIIALGIRPIAPRPKVTVERRSPLEHVDALARAYEQVGATRRASSLLLRGLRRRRDAAAWRRSDDAAFLRAVSERYPEVRNEVVRLQQATQTKQGPAELVSAGEAVATIERTLTRE